MLHQQFWVDRQADELLAGFVDGLFRLHGENWVRIFSQRAAGEKRQEAKVPLAKVHPDLRRSDAQLEPKNGMLFCYIRKMCRFRAILIVLTQPSLGVPNSFSEFIDIAKLIEAALITRS
jgi:hypothetical protein